MQNSKLNLTEIKTINLEATCDSEIYGNNGMTEIMAFEVKNGKVKFLGDTCDAFQPRFQKIKTNGKGDFVNLGSERWYLSYQSSVELFNLLK